MNILLLTNHLADYSGSEMQILELYRYFKKRADRVHVYANYINTPFCLEFNEKDIFQDIQTINVTEYQFIWAQHAIFSRLFSEKTPSFQTHLMSVHLSPYEMLELSSLHYMKDLNAHFIANSPETQNKLCEFGIEKQNIIVSFNAAPQDFVAPPPPKNAVLRKIAIVSNHPPEELIDAAELLRQRQIHVDIFGLRHEIQAMTPDLIQNYDAIVSIGKTVQYALLSNRALYCYDHFGGCGYLNENNYFIAKEHNFSGRGGFGKKTAQEIADEIETGFAENVIFIQQIKDKNDYILENFMEKLLALPPIRLPENPNLSMFAAAEKKIAEYYGNHKHFENALKQERIIWQNEKQHLENQNQNLLQEKTHYLEQLNQIQNHLENEQQEKNHFHNILEQERQFHAQKNQKRKRKRKIGILVGLLVAGFLYWL